MHWLEALEQYLRLYRQSRRRSQITCATVEAGLDRPLSQDSCELIGNWWIEERVTPCGNIALHLFPFLG